MCLLEQSNIRQDEYGGSAERRARIVLEITQQIRNAVPANFCIGIKLNSADLNTSECEDTMSQIRLFADAGIDFLEISGGSYEDPTVRIHRMINNNPVLENIDQPTNRVNKNR